MQAFHFQELSSSLSFNFRPHNQDQFTETATEKSPALSDVNNPTDDQDQRSKLHEAETEAEAADEEEDDEDFSFVCSGDDSSPILSDDLFSNGQIRPIFPLFNRDLLLADYESETSINRLPMRPPVNKVFIESTSSESEEIDGVAAGPYCDWSKKAIENSPEICKKSNSTGFSKLWRFRDYLNRSNSDGRDAFVFLNNSPAASVKTEEKVVEKSEGSSEKKAVREGSSGKKAAGEVKVNAAGGKGTGKKGVKSKTASLSAHEVYMRSRGLREEGRRRSYLPYRPELVGFFTNVNGGLSKNVHPF